LIADCRSLIADCRLPAFAANSEGKDGLSPLTPLRSRQAPPRYVWRRNSEMQRGTRRASLS